MEYFALVWMQEDKTFFLPLKDKCLQWRKINNRLVTLCTELVNKKLETRYIRIGDQVQLKSRKRICGKSLEERTLSKVQDKIILKYKEVKRCMIKLENCLEELMKHIDFLKNDSEEGICRLGPMKLHYATNILANAAAIYQKEILTKKDIVKNIFSEDDRNILLGYTTVLLLEPDVQDFANQL